jgi:hypothetical protein
LTDTEPVEDIVPRMIKQFSEQPRGWRIMHTPTGEMLVLGPDSMYQLKLIPLNPFQFTGAGVEIADVDNKLAELRSSPEFGLRPLKPSDIRSLLEAINKPTLLKPRIDELVKREPVAPSEIDSRRVSHLLSGPVIARPELGSLSPRTLELQDLLNESATRMFRRRYPMRTGMYF